MFFARYDKAIIEPFALNVIAASFNSEYLSYVQPKDTDNFDFISIDKEKALEVTLAVPKDEMNIYIYEKELTSGKKDLDSGKVNCLNWYENGMPGTYYVSNCIQDIEKKIETSLRVKEEKVIKRMSHTGVKKVDLCICIPDGSLYDMASFELAFPELEKHIFENVFFITSSKFIRFNKTYGFEEYERKLS